MVLEFGMDVAKHYGEGPPAMGLWEVSGKSPESLWKVSGECFWTLPGLFGDSFRVPEDLCN